MDSMRKRGYAIALCAAVVIACLATAPATAEPIEERETTAPEQSGRSDLSLAVARPRFPANGLTGAARPCSLPGNQDRGYSHAETPALFRTLICWWRDGLLMQSRAPLP